MNLSSIQAITLDLYGTILDVESSVRHSFSEFLAGKGYNGSPAEVVHAWEVAYFQETLVDTLLAHGRTPFEQISRSCLGQVLSRLGLSVTDDEVAVLIASRARGEVFQDVKDGLDHLKTRYTLAVLSNGDLESLERTVVNLALPVDHVISAEQAGVYKPHPSVYRTAIETLGLEPEQVIHVAAHAWDIRGAVAFGMRGAFVNRAAITFDDSPFQPDLEVSDLVDLSTRLP